VLRKGDDIFPVIVFASPACPDCGAPWEPICPTRSCEGRKAPERDMWASKGHDRPKVAHDYRAKSSGARCCQECGTEMHGSLCTNYACPLGQRLIRAGRKNEPRQAKAA
jgi:hypothetical protein